MKYRKKRIKPANWAFAALGLLSVWLMARPAWSQGLTPEDNKEKARFEAVRRDVEKNGYSGPVVVGLSRGAEAGLFALLATRGDKAVLLVTVEPSGKETDVPVEIESDKRPVDIGVKSVRFDSFLGQRDLVDVIVAHHPFRLEVTYVFDRHYVMRRSGPHLTVTCDFDGSSKSAYAKGMRTVSAERTVTIENAAGAGPFQFDLKSIQVTTEQSAQGPAAIVEHSENVIRYILLASGRFTPVKK